MTQSHQFDSGAVQHEHQLVVALQPKLQLYADREFRELPPQLQEQIRAIKSLNLPTQSGLERIEPVLSQLANLRFLLEKILNGESIDEAVKRLSEPIPEPGSILEGLTPGEQVLDGSVIDDQQPPVAAKSVVIGTLTLGAEQARSKEQGAMSTPTKPPQPTGGTLTLGSTPKPPVQSSSNSGTLVLPDDLD